MMYASAGPATEANELGLPVTNVVPLSLVLLEGFTWRELLPTVMHPLSTSLPKLVASEA
ncbi:hypothetical protein IF2G_01648 [Cordyceps javanica]|nr:hypothetical protein IF2G_01648 [Cordyceps javanica]